MHKSLLRIILFNISKPPVPLFIDSNIICFPCLFMFTKIKVHRDHNSWNSQHRSGMVASPHGRKHMPRPTPPAKQSLDVSRRPRLLRRVGHLGSRRPQADLRQPRKLPGAQLVLPRRSSRTFLHMATT